MRTNMIVLLLPPFYQIFISASVLYVMFVRQLASQLRIKRFHIPIVSWAPSLTEISSLSPAQREGDSGGEDDK